MTTTRFEARTLGTSTTQHSQTHTMQNRPTETTDYIDTNSIDNLFQLFCERLNRSPDETAYRYYEDSTGIWQEMTWSDIAREVSCWQTSLQKEQLTHGDAVAVMLRNCIEWVIFDLAAHSLGLVVVPLYTDDRADNVCYILNDSNVQLLLIDDGAQWEKLHAALKNVTGLKRILSRSSMTGTPHDSRLRWINDWLDDQPHSLEPCDVKSDALATVVYTSGTTGRPKGVMLSHRNIQWNVKASLACVDIFPGDVFISCLPLSHTSERLAGYYLPICANATVAYARSIAELAEDMLVIKPTLMISVPRIFERIYNKIHEQLQQKPALAKGLFNAAVEIGYAKFLHAQGKGNWRAGFLLLPLLHKLVSNKILAKFGGELRLCICGGAALPPAVAKTFIGLGLPILQGYGLTEHSPVISANRLHDNIPESVGVPLPGVEVKTSAQGELLVRSPSVMMGYLNNKDATDKVIDEEGWLHTGDKVEIRDKHIFITGRLKEIIVLSNGEKIPPTDMEMAIQQDPLFEQVMVVGEHKPYLTALVVLNQEYLQANPETGISAMDDERRQQYLVQRVSQRLQEFPGYAQIHRVAVCEQPWTIDNNLLTPTLKPRRQQIHTRYDTLIEQMYAGH